MSMAGQAVPWGAPVDIDYIANTISIPALQIEGSAIITDRIIKFQSADAYYGSLDRLSGDLNVIRGTDYGVKNVHARCRPATQKF